MSGSSNLPEQMHAPRSTEVAVARPVAGAYDLDGQDIRLPRMKVGQSATPAVRQKIVSEGDVFVQRTRDDVEPTVIQDNSELAFGELTDPVRFYVHSAKRGVNFKDPAHPDAGYNDIVLGPWHVTVLEFAQRNPQYDVRDLYRKYDYTITVPGYEALPVAFLMASSWGGAAASDLNTTIQTLKAAGTDVLSVPFRVQFKATTRGDNTYMKAFVGLAKVNAKDRKADEELVQQHALLLPHAVIEDEEAESRSSGVGASAPSVA